MQEIVAEIFGNLDIFSYLCNCNRDYNCDHRLRLGKA